jgi:hypothetical protein
MAGHIGAFLELALELGPELMEVLRRVQLCPAAVGEARIADSLYDRIGSTDFSRHVLSRGIARLVSMALEGVEWNDLGDPERVIATLVRKDMDLPCWARLWSKRKAELAEGEMSISVVA